MIKSNEISIILQGAIDVQNTPLCISSIRKIFHDAVIIVSTWEGAEVSSLKPDRLLLNKDPGGFKDKMLPKFTNNLLRQLVSTQNALEVVNTKYTLKMRTDLLLKSSHFLNYYDMFPEYDKNYKIYNHKIISLSYFFKRFLSDGKSKMYMPVPFRMSDWFQFGLTEDIKKLYMIDLPQEPEQSNYMCNFIFNDCKPNFLKAAHRYAPEQYIAYNSYKNNILHTPVRFDNYMDYDNTNIEESERFIMNNFIILSPQEANVLCLKENTNSDYYNKWCRKCWTLPACIWDGLFRPYIYRVLYRKYCDSNYKIPINIKFGDFIERLLISGGRACIIR